MATDTDSTTNHRPVYTGSVLIEAALRRKMMPSLPQSLSEVNPPDCFMETSDGLPFLCIDNGDDYKIICFATSDRLTLLQEVDTLYMDGTFYCCPTLWGSDVIQTDFEIAAINAIETVFPNCNIRGCYFHFTQALWRKVQTLGFNEAYQQDS
ncbi:uncharacterized protein [Haliotis asinina]|uniref:uncharacterized protein n=1 Tax=Haliotis asinina TaxID=109174 RepID=UPI003532723E